MSAAKASPKPRAPSWNKGDNIKLKSLFGNLDGVDPEIDGTQANIEEVRVKHISHIPYRNFRTLWLKKSAQYIVHGLLSGANNSVRCSAKLSEYSYYHYFA